MHCAIRGAAEESDSHILSHCPMAVEIWSNSGFDYNLWDGNFPSLMECILHASNSLDCQRLGDSVAVLWECRNARNHFIFGGKVGNLSALAARAICFVHNYRKIKEGADAQVRGNAQV